MSGRYAVFEEVFIVLFNLGEKQEQTPAFCLATKAPDHLDHPIDTIRLKTTGKT